MSAPGQTEGGDDGGPVHHCGHQQHGHDGDAVPLYGPDDQSVTALTVQLRVPGLGSAHPRGGHLAAAVRESGLVTSAPLGVSPVRVLSDATTTNLENVR